MTNAFALLGDIATLQAGFGFPPSLQGRANGQYPFAKVGDISRGGRSESSILSRADHYVDAVDVAAIRAKIVPPGSTLFAKIGEAIRQNHRVVAGCEMLIDNNAMAAIPNARVDSRFLYHFLKTVDFYCLAPATTVPALRKSDLEKLRVPLPPLPEQRRTAAILDQADALRAKRREALAQLDSLAQSIFIEMFGDPAANPRGWPHRSVGDTASKFSDGPFGSNLKSSDYTETGIRVIRLQNIGVGQLVDKDKAFVSEAHFNKLRKHECLPGDVLIGTLGDPNLRACIQPSTLARALNKADCVQLRPDPKVANAEYLCALLNQPAVESMAQEFMLGQTRVRISMGRLRGLRVPMPPLALQETFATRIQAVESLKAAHRAALTELNALFASLQHRAFAGQLS